MSGTIKLIRLRFARQWKVMLGMALVGTALSAGAWEIGLLGLPGAERSAYDDGLKFFTQNRTFPWGREPRSSEIVIVAIDDKTFEGVSANPSYRINYGAWPYSRNLWAQVLGHLVDEGARMVVFDAVIDEPHSDPSGDLAMAEVIRTRKIPFYAGFSFVAGQRVLPHVDAVNKLPEAPLPAPQPEVVEPPAEGAPSAETESFETFEEAAPAESADAGSVDPSPEAVAAALAFPFEVTGGVEVRPIPVEVLTGDDGNPTGETRPRLPRAPIPPLLDAAPGFGAVTLEADEDGVMRRTAFAYTDGVNHYPTLALAVAADWFGAKKVTLAPGELRLGDHVVHVNADGSAEIDYGGTVHQRFRSVSLLNVIDDLALKERGEPRKPALQGMFKDKLVMLAGFAVGTADVKATPFDQQSPGVAKHAAELHNLLHDAFIVRAPYWLSLLLAFGVAFFSVSLITVVKSPVLEIGWPVFLFFAFFLLTGSVLVATKLHVLSAMPMTAGELASVASVAYNHLLAKKDREQLKEMFQAYMEKDLVEQLIELRELPKLDGESVEVTAFFSDIRGFSSFSERYREDPKALMRVLNRYLSRITPVLKRHGACIDKYIGDAVVCLFGAPLRNDAHAFAACKGALAVQREVAALRAEFQAEGLPDVYTRIGLNTDVMLVGNIGSADLLDYTALGDGMNLASRLEGSNKTWETLIVMGPRTYAQVKDQVEARELDQVRVAGKAEVVTVYELLALKGDLPETKGQVVALYARALAAYREAKFAEAGELLSQARKLDPEDGPSRTLSTRCAELLANPPDKFDAVIALEK
jgi:adenylate cyclase